MIWFGSWPQGKAGPRSDIDVAISTGSVISPERMAALREAVDELPTLYAIDVVDLNATGPILHEEILQHGAAYDRASRCIGSGDYPFARGIKRGDVSRDAAIQRFEFCFELAWKSIQERAREEGLDCQTPRSCLQLAFKILWIEDEQGWLAMLQDRNRTSHTYDEELAQGVFRRLPNHLPLAR